MIGFPSAPLGEIANVVRGVTFSKAEAVDKPAEGMLPVLRAGNIQDSLVLDDDLVYVPREKVNDKQILRQGDIVICTSSGSSEVVGKTAFARKNWEGSFGAFCAGIRANPNKCDPSFLFYYLRSPAFRSWTQKSAGANIKNIRKSELDLFEVPLPSHADQRRIAAILDKADGIRRKREQALQMADQLLRSTFLNMFGDPVRNPHRYVQKSLSECARFISGSTPSKKNSSYWDGNFPWVSPKDMKVDLIADAEDHVSDLAFAETNLKKVPANMPLIVVRGMILAHTVPIALTQREVAINQDMKAVEFGPEIDPVFGLWSLKVLHDKILSEVDTAAHGTKRIDMSRLGALPILIQGDNLQREFVAIVEKFGDAQKRLEAALSGAKDMFSSLSQRAFRGEL
jgi:type I restriction enzyme S subunit